LNHGGLIEVSSQEGEGSTFTISLPISSAQAQVVDASAGPLDTNGAHDV
jgi:chemotaxis protein histidine kinase CheA